MSFVKVGTACVAPAWADAACQPRASPTEAARTERGNRETNLQRELFVAKTAAQLRRSPGRQQMLENVAAGRSAPADRRSQPRHERTGPAHPRLDTPWRSRDPIGGMKTLWLCSGSPCGDPIALGTLYGASQTIAPRQCARARCSLCKSAPFRDDRLDPATTPRNALLLMSPEGVAQVLPVALFVVPDFFDEEVADEDKHGRALIAGCSIQHEASQASTVDSHVGSREMARHMLSARSRTLI